jgi:hypothetical protein
MPEPTTATRAGTPAPPTLAVTSRWPGAGAGADDWVAGSAVVAMVRGVTLV